MEKEEALTVIESNIYELASMAKPVEIASSIRQRIMETKTDKNYIQLKQNFPYIKSTYMDNEFKKNYPIYKITILRKDIISNYWVTYDIEIKAYLTPSIYISEVGTGGARFQIPKNMKKAIEEGKMNATQLSPLDYIDIGNDCKSALTKAIANAQSRFGIGADVYNKGIFPQEVREAVERAIREIIDTYVVLPMEKIRFNNAWQEIKEKNGNILDFLEQLRNKYNVFEENPIT